MILWNSGSNCEEARGYYYDCADGQCQDKIPKGVQVHVMHCDHCQEEIHRLGEVLKTPSTSDPEAGSRVSTINDMLEMHFKYVDVPVTCAVAKRFLPSMAALATRITIPTPITVHLEQCSICRDDWSDLESLHLSDIQLQRLTECIEESDVQPKLSRHEHLTQEQVQTFANLGYASFDTACLEHVCLCAPCRERTLAVRQTGAIPLSAEFQACQEISWEDLFDLALPVGFNPLADEYARFRKAVVDHIGGCKVCLSRLGRLDRMLVNLLAPHECGAVTHFQLNLDETPSHAQAAYEDYPILVGVEDARHREPVGVADQAQPASGRMGGYASSRWMKVAAVVVVFLGVTTFSIMPHAGADYWDQVYESTTDSPVVHFEVYVHGSPMASSEYWIMPPNRALVREGQTWEDRNASAGWIANAAGMAVPRRLSADSKKAMQRSIRGLYDLWPFEASEAAKKVSDEQGPSDVYELSMGTFLWRATVDRETQRVVQVEREDADGRLMRRYEVKYPSVSDFKARLEQHGFDAAGL
ncbi:MAG: hypothetical protein GY809_15915 [Planctomycetes bacterium]|nr:hypothetical protein [Planctomycetota bacterium]